MTTKADETTRLNNGQKKHIVQLPHLNEKICKNKSNDQWTVQWYMLFWELNDLGLNLSIYMYMRKLKFECVQEQVKAMTSGIYPSQTLDVNKTKETLALRCTINSGQQLDNLYSPHGPPFHILYSTQERQNKKKKPDQESPKNTKDISLLPIP